MKHKDTDVLDENRVLAQRISELRSILDGEIHSDRLTRVIYSTDASDYRELPLAVAYPKNERDLQELVRFAVGEKITLIPRTAGTSLAGQVVGSGLVVDLSHHMNEILEVNEKERWVRVQPGVILDELNISLRSTGLFFSPETSTSNRSMIGGMIGNNSCGLHSLVHGTTRDHTLSVRAVLSDGSVAEFGSLGLRDLEKKLELDTLEGIIYRTVHEMLSDEEVRQEITREYPDPAVVRRNTGYALDEVMNCPVYSRSGAKYPDLNLCRIIAGSEGTLLILSEAKLNLVPQPPPHRALVPVHFHSVMEAIRGNLVALKQDPMAVELMDKTILDCTRENLLQKKNRFFLEGDPGAILMVELADENESTLDKRIGTLEEQMRSAGLGYHFPVVRGKDIGKVWALRKAGLGVLSNLPGEGRPVSVIEDTSVNVQVLEDYISEFNRMLDGFGLKCVYHAHISVGELHLRPILNLKESRDVELFHEIALETARLVKKYRGSLSGEHGDGRLRGEFIPLMVGEQNFELLRRIKKTFDPEGVFNAGKIIDTPPMNSSLRYSPGHSTPDFKTYFDFSREGGFMKLVEKCNGSGDCRKTEITGGTMCPSYMATRDESATTRARANVLREMLSNPEGKHPFDQPGIYQVLDLCLSCKACKSECPSNVDMAKLKAEFLQHWYEHHRIPLRTRIIAGIYRINRLGMILPGFFNFMVGSRRISGFLKKGLGFAAKRNLPFLGGNRSARRWGLKHLEQLNSSLPADAGEVVLYLDEFTNYNDVAIGIKTMKLFNKLNIRVIIVDHGVSARTFISKGLLKKAGPIIRRNIDKLHPVVTGQRPLVGIEPSAILGFRDEFPELAGPGYAEKARDLASNAYTLEEYLVKLLDEGALDRTRFTGKKRSILLHGHCQQKAISGTESTIRALSIPEHYSVEEIPSGCCGMAGSFGYEKEHYEVSMKVGELVLFPVIRDAGEEILLVAPGTSCRHQIRDGTGKEALHPVEVLYDALEENK